MFWETDKAIKHYSYRLEMERLKRDRLARDLKQSKEKIEWLERKVERLNK